MNMKCFSTLKHVAPMLPSSPAVPQERLCGQKSKSFAVSCKLLCRQNVAQYLLRRLSMLPGSPVVREDSLCKGNS